MYNIKRNQTLKHYLFMDILTSKYIRFKAIVPNNLRFLALNFSLIFFTTIFLGIFSAESEIVKCEWDNKESTSCLVINKSIPNTSQFSAEGVRRYIITSSDIG